MSHLDCSHCYCQIVFVPVNAGVGSSEKTSNKHIQCCMCGHRKTEE